MTLLNNSYSDLLQYLESQKTKKSEPELTDSDSLKIKKSNTAIKTNKLLDESLEDFHSDVVIGTPLLSSKGFDVKEFESLMRAKLVDEHKRMQSYDRPYISVSELLSCIRQKYYVRMKYPVDIKQQYSFSYLYLINKVGNKVHDIIQDLYYHTEVEKTIISEKYKVKGRADGIRHNFLNEYKTIDEKKFNGKYNARDYHQAIIYAHILNTEYNYKIDTITIVYIIRNLKRIVPFDLSINSELAIEFLNRAPILRNCITEHHVPEPIGSDKEQCKYCSYKKNCEQDKDNLTKPIQDKQKKSVFLI